MIRHFALAALAAAALLGAAACDSKPEAPAAAAAAPAADAKKPDPKEVFWPPLRELDDLMHRAAAMAKAGKVEDLRKMAPAIFAAMRATAAGQVPDNAKNKSLVETLRADLKPLSVTFEKPGEKTDEELKDAVAQTFAIVHKLMAEAGMPHKHDHDHDGHDHEDHDHDHEGHDHDHDHSDPSHRH
jgi:hypothetical protein